MSDEEQIKNFFQDFWEKGNGYEFKTWAKTNPTLKSNLRYEEAFYEYDKQADAIVVKLFQENEFQKVIHLLSTDCKPEDLPIDVRNLLLEMKQMPSWVNEDVIKIGTEVSLRSGFSGLMVLRNFCLLGGYYFSSLTNNLIKTGALEKGPTTRLYNTLTFWYQVNQLGVNANDKRLYACLKIRLIHSAARLMIQKHSRLENSIIPLNDIDMVATNIGFTVYFLYGSRKLGFRVSEKEEEAFFHLWKYITWLLGVPLDLIPNNKKEAVDFFYYWTSKQGLPDENSIVLTESLMKENSQIDDLMLGVIKNNIGYIHSCFANFLLDEQTKQALHIAPAKYYKIIPNLNKIITKLSKLKSKANQIKDGDELIQKVLKSYENRK